MSGKSKEILPGKSKGNASQENATKPWKQEDQNPMSQNKGTWRNEQSLMNKKCLWTLEYNPEKTQEEKK